LCGAQKASDFVVDMLRDLSVTERQIKRLRDDEKIDPETFQKMSRALSDERIRLTTRKQDVNRTVHEVPTPVPEIEVEQRAYSFVDVHGAAVEAEESYIAPVPSFLADRADSKTHAIIETRPTQPPPRPPRRSFTEVLNAFMEESNIRWGEIIGGLLIIGCSTALVVSLWSQISQIPVLKFLIFTTVTAVLFGIGMYTEHRWKLPTTSRGILTIATLLVPLNFLAIAAVSSSDTSGALVLASEFLAPAIFLCLVYFAGRVITRGCAHLLAGGILGSSIGQLLVRHFASTDAPPELLVFLGGFPVACYVVTVGLALRKVLADRQIDESETSIVFTILGTMSFAALLPFGLLLHKAGPLGMTMMYLAPLVTLWGVPMLATGTVLWRRIQDKNLVASRTTGTALGILGLLIAVAGMILAWPNPASIIPAALLNFAILTILAVVLEVSFAHLIAAGCFGLAYLVSFHVFAGHLRWINLRVASLLEISLDITSGQALTGAFAGFVIASEWLQRIDRHRDSYYYRIAACSVAVISLVTVTAFGPIAGNNLQAVWIVYLIYALGAFWIAWRQRLTAFSWVGSALLLFALASEFAWNGQYSFPWQTAFLVHASICAVVAIIASRRSTFASMSKPLNYAALISSILAVGSLFQTNPWQVTAMQAERVFWIAGIWLLSLWLTRRQLLFVAFQIAVTSGVILTVKAALQEYEWYLYRPHAFLHPSALQIQGTMLALLTLVWISLRLGMKKLANTHPASVGDFCRMLDTRYSIVRTISWLLLGAFVLLSTYGAMSGVISEFGLGGLNYSGWNIAGFAHQDAFALGSWIVFGLLAVIMLVNAWERRQRIYLSGALVALSTLIPLLAGRFEAQLATATAWRFLAALFLLVTSVLVWSRERILAQLSLFGWPQLDESHSELSSRARTLVILLTVAPLLLLTLFPALRAIAHEPVLVPVAGIFSWLNNDLSYSVPLVVVAMVFVGYAVRECLPRFNFYSGLVFNLTVTLAYVLSVVAVNVPIDSVVLVKAIQLNAITFAVHSLLWLSLRGRWLQGLESRARDVDSLVKLEVALAAGLNILILAPLTLSIILYNDPESATHAAASMTGWVALTMTAAAVVLIGQSLGKRLSTAIVSSLLLAIVCLTAFGFTGGDNSIELRVLTGGTALAAGFMFAASYLTTIQTQQTAILKFEENWSRTAIKVSAIIGGVAAILSLRVLTVLDGTGYWWAIVPLVSLSALAAALQWRTQKAGFLYAAGILFNIAVSTWWLAYESDDRLQFPAFLEINITAACLAGVLWLVLDLRGRRVKGLTETTRLRYHDVVVLISATLLIVVTLFRFFFDGVATSDLEFTWIAWLATVVLMFATLWDGRAKYTTAGLYTLGLVGGAIGLHQLDLPTNNQTWSAMMFFTLYALATSLLWRKRAIVIGFAERVGIPVRIDPTATQLNWLSVVSIISVLLVGLMAYWIDLRFLEFGLRATAAIAVVAQATTFGLLAEGVWSERWRRASIAVFLVGMVLFGWAWLTPDFDATWLNRSVILLVEAFGFTALYGLFLDKARSIHVDWTNSFRACVPGLLSAGVVALLFCLSTEVFYQLSFGAVRIHPVSLFAIGITLVAAVLIPVLFALSPAHDPLSLSEQGRMKYVYAAELMLALLFVHIRLTMPWLFSGFFEKYWPLVVMAVAYLGVVSSESLRRRKVLVLAQPIERTGAFLPLLPVLGFWLATSQVDYSSLLFVVGGLYGLLSLLRRSFVFGALAAVAGNAGLWYLLHRTADYQFLQHPQLWLIPVALSVLLAGYLNEDNLSDDQLAGIRYLSLVTVYASSTADIFINGVANSPWLPLILGAFSLAGVFSGIMFRIRGLLFLGSVFLLLSIITMIWYASANLGWTWLWYVAGIATGATIIFMFAVFEKKRSEVLRVVEGLKEWEV
jgi:hypothetical protein